MKKFIVLMQIITIFSITSPTFADKVKIPERTVIPVKLTQHLKGDQVTIGQSVDFEVARDIIIDNFIVIKRGAPAYGDITTAEKGGYVSQGGKIGLAIDHCKAIDGSKVYLKSILQKEQESHMGANIAASVIVCPLFLLMRGEEAEIPIGTQFKSYVENEVFVEVLASEKLTDKEISEIQEKDKQSKNKRLASIPKKVTDAKINKVKLRDIPKELWEPDIKKMIEKHNFFEKDLHDWGDFPNDFVDNGDGTITDRVTGLMWEKGGSSRVLHFWKAKKYVSRLNREMFAGYNGWRIPTLEELCSLLEQKVNERGQYIGSPFNDKQSKCLGADRLGGGRYQDYCVPNNIINFRKGKIDETATENAGAPYCQSMYYYIRAVRTIK